MEDIKLDNADGDADPENKKQQILIERGIVALWKNAAMSFCAFIKEKVRLSVPHGKEGILVCR